MILQSKPPILKGTLQVPGDKSISHRALMLLGLSPGTASIQNLSNGKDVLSTLACMRQLGVDIQQTHPHEYLVTGPKNFQQPNSVLDCGNSGTTLRLLSGLLSGANLDIHLSGDASLHKRPMNRIIDPLSQMGASIDALGPNGTPPIHIQCGRPIHGIRYSLPMASAQVKSAILMAGLWSTEEDDVVVEETFPSRDHTERMLSALNVGVQSHDGKVTLYGRKQHLVPQDLVIPRDISSAAFWLIGAALLPGSEVRLHQVGLNPFRTGVLDILNSVGVIIDVENKSKSGGEPFADLIVRGSELQGNIVITPEIVPGLIDEIPIITVLGLFAQGTVTCRGLEELRHKESDRLGSLIEILKRLNVEITKYSDGFAFEGDPERQLPLLQTPFQTYHDHRLVMALEILNLKSPHPLPIEGQEWVEISYPGFYPTLNQLISP